MKKKSFEKLNLRQQKILARSYVIGAFVVALLLILAPKIGIYALYQQSLYGDSLLRQKEQLTKENLELATQITAFENDLGAVEEFARKERMMLRENEHLYVFPSKEK